MTKPDTSIGGYMEFELRQGSEYHPDALRINNARNALILLLQIKGIKKVLLPFYTCGVVLEALQHAECDYEFYSLDKELMPLGLSGSQSSGDWLLYTNYFGLCDRQSKLLQERWSNLIVDNAQAFFAKPITGIPTIYSSRKFFGVPDGAYLYPGEQVDFKALALEPSFSHSKSSHLVKRIELGAEEGYPDFKTNEDLLSNEPIRSMSELSRRIMASIDYASVCCKRRENYQYLHQSLGQFNELSSNITDMCDSVPLCYPLLVSNPGIRDFLIRNRIFVPTYWHNVCQWAGQDSWDCHLANHIVPLPVDQRYGKAEMERICRLLILTFNDNHASN